MGARKLGAAVAIGCALIGMSAPVASASTACPGDDQTPTASTLADAARSAACDINAYRTQHGLQPLTLNVRLQSAAQALAEDEAQHQFMSHTDSSGGSIY